VRCGAAECAVAKEVQAARARQKGVSGARGEREVCACECSAVIECKSARKIFERAKSVSARARAKMPRERRGGAQMNRDERCMPDPRARAQRARCARRSGFSRARAQERAYARAIRDDALYACAIIDYFHAAAVRAPRRARCARARECGAARALCAASGGALNARARSARTMRARCARCPRDT